ncbi:MAG: hypothetical protein IPK80_04520 [Nannocystis sp.]|nr:hypothetical protein [Nannocystis sp.]
MESITPWLGTKAPRPSDEVAAAALEVLANGGEQSRRQLFRWLERIDVHELAPLRRRLVEGLQVELRHQVDDEGHAGSWTRSWQVSALVVCAGEDPEARRLIDHFSDRAREPNRWVRFWALATAAGRPEHAGWLVSRARALAADALEAPLLRCLAWALLAEREGDRAAQQALLWCLRLDGAAAPAAAAPLTQGVTAQAAALRALRVVALPEAFDAVQALVDDCAFAPHTFDAIWVMGKFHGPARAAEASHTLARFVVTHRRRREFQGMVGFALRAIGALGIPQTELLLAELESASAGVIVEAAQALELLLGAERAVERLVDISVERQDADPALGNALRCMQRAAVIDALDRSLRCGVSRREEAARRLLIELGGTVAVDRAQARRQDLEVRRQVVAELDVRQRNHVKWIAFGDGAATWISVGMWIAVFGLGLGGVIFGMVLVSREGLAAWQGWAMSAGGGLFSILGKLGFNGRMVETAGARAAARLAVFTGYQRRLQQIDLLLAQRFIDGVALTIAELETLGGLIGAAQRDVQRGLMSLIPAEREGPTSAAPTSEERPPGA